MTTVIRLPGNNTALARLVRVLRDLGVSELGFDRKIGPKFFHTSTNPEVSAETQALLDGALALSRADRAARLALDVIEGVAGASQRAEALAALRLLLNSGPNCAELPDGGGDPANDNAAQAAVEAPAQATLAAAG